MAKIKIEYTVKMKQTLYWPDSELKNLSHKTLLVNLEPSIDYVDGDYDITSVILNGKELRTIPMNTDWHVRK